MRLAWALIVALLFVACGGEEPIEPARDAGAIDDASTPDAHPPDAEEPDAGDAPILACDDRVLDFGERVIGTSTSTTLDCAVSGGAPGEILTLDRLETDDAQYFATAAETSSTSFAIAVRFTPTLAGDHPATLTVHYLSRGAEKTAAIPISGTAVLPLDWDPLVPTATCSADLQAPLLDRALAATALDRDTFGFTTADLASSRYYAAGDLSDEFMLSWLFDARAKPHRAGCLEGRVAAKLDRLLAARHPVAEVIRHAAALVDRPVPEDVHPFDPRLLPGDFDAALAAICKGPCGRTSGALPSDLRARLTPILWAIAAGLDARAARDPAASMHDAAWWQQFGANGVLITTSSQRYDVTDDADRNYLFGAERARLNGAAAQIAYAIEETDWAPYTGRTGVQFELVTPAGVIRVRDAAADRYEADNTPVLFLLDLGGDDVHLDEVASNRSAANAVSIAIDLAGTDHYGYDEVATPYDRDGLLPADDGGRYAGNENYGNVALSRRFRQGAARNGIALLFDLGDGNDTYRSLQGSQGYAHQGVGILFDAGGDDTYLAESGAQGAALFGIGLAIDAGAGDDQRRSFAFSQGFGFSQGAGIILDGGGDDTYSCDHGDPARGGIPFYYSPQLPGSGNTSMCQGAGFGLRGEEPRTFLSGGLGVLRDSSGDDRYEASVYAQGTGYWQGIGILSDGDGSDIADAYWYVQGAAAHYSMGIFANGGEGHDRFNETREAINVHLGAGHDFSAGVYISGTSSAAYHLAALSAGSSHCNAVGLFVDNGGDDHYFASSDYGSGSGSVGEECRAARPDAVSIGVMIDAGGVDTYTYPMSNFAIPADNTSWGHARLGLPVEHGAGLDAEGASGVQSEY